MRWATHENRKMSVTARLLVSCLLGTSVSACTPVVVTPPAANPAAISATQSNIDAEPLLAASLDKARQAGAAEASTLGAKLLAEGELLGGFVTAPEASCMLAMARPGTSVKDVDLFVYSDSGERLAADEAPEARATVLVCPPHPRRLYVAARLVAGEGMLALAVMQVPAKQADKVAAAVGVRGRPGQDTGKLEGWPGLEAKIRSRRAQLGSGWEDVRRVTMPLHPDAPSVLSAALPARRCLDVMVVPEEAVQSIDVQVLDDSGRIIGLGKPPGHDRSLLLCSEVEQRITIVVRPRVSSGLAAVVVARSAEGAASELPAGIWVDGASALYDVAKAVALHQTKTKRLRLDEPRKLGAAQLMMGSPRSLDVNLSGGCSRIDAVAGTPLGPFRASLWNQQGDDLSESRGAAFATLFHCAPADEKLRIELLATHSGGPVEVYVRRDASPPAALVQYPLAAARLLRRLEAELGPVDAKDAAGARAVTLAAGARHQERISIPAKACERIIAASDGPAGALQLQLRDGAGNISRSRGYGVVSARPCAGATATQLTVELTSSISGAALLLRRPLTEPSP